VEGVVEAMASHPPSSLVKNIREGLKVNERKHGRMGEKKRYIFPL
jgi:hypothetical protein